MKRKPPETEYIGPGAPTVLNEHNLEVCTRCGVMRYFHEHKERGVTPPDHAFVLGAICCDRCQPLLNFDSVS
jgi:hypothetical protein